MFVANRYQKRGPSGRGILAVPKEHRYRRAYE